MPCRSFTKAATWKVGIGELMQSVQLAPLRKTACRIQVGLPVWSLYDLRGEISERAWRRLRRRREQRDGKHGGGRGKDKVCARTHDSADFINELGPRDCFVADQWIAFGERSVCSDRDQMQRGTVMSELDKRHHRLSACALGPAVRLCRYRPGHRDAAAIPKRGSTPPPSAPLCP